MSNLINIEKHCHYVSLALNWIISQVGSCEKVAKDGETVSLTDGEKWLEVASSIVAVEVDTARFDPSINMCRRAYEYQMAKTDTLTPWVTSLSVFNFVWGAFESIVKAIEPPKVPRSIKKDANFIDEAAYYLKEQFDCVSPISGYKDCLADLLEFAGEQDDSASLLELFRLQPHVSLVGVGIMVVRRVRNKFAHGTINVPVHKDYGEVSTFGHDSILASSRMVLLTIQMLLIALLKEESFEVDVIEDINGFARSQDVHTVLRGLQLVSTVVETEEPSLFTL